ncbi:MAG: class I SAM-dependent methyltransferase [Gemmatimonadales bacterium]|nr:class I SAM-dependent methyltransferase [Gemmatimonadales bacterium]
MKALLHRILPFGARLAVHQWRRDAVFRRAWGHFASGAPMSPALWEEMVWGWGNDGWSARHEYLEGVVAAARAARGSILECGSGLSTLVLARIAADRGLRLRSLEHFPEWRKRVRSALRHAGLDDGVVVDAPLGDVAAGIRWYAPAALAGLDPVHLVICDGPPHDVPGGRYGLLPVARSVLAPGAVIMLDDAARPEETAIRARWQAEAGWMGTLIGQDKPYARLVVPAARPTRR